MTWGDPYSQCKSQPVLGASLWFGENICPSPVQSYGQLTAGDTGWELQSNKCRAWRGTQHWAITLGGSGEVALGRKAGVSRGVPPQDLAFRGAEAGDGSLLPCPFQQTHPTAFSVHYALCQSCIFYSKEQHWFTSFEHYVINLLATCHYSTVIHQLMCKKQKK